MSQSERVRARFYPPPEDLRRYFTTFYLTEMIPPDGELIVDALQPEWANLRFFTHGAPDGWIEGGNALGGASFVGIGPTSRATHFTVGPCRFWGIGMLPLGWASFMDTPASTCTNRLADGDRDPAFAHFAPLHAAILSAAGDAAKEYDAIVAHFRAMLGKPPRDERLILAIHDAIVDAGVSTVAALVARAQAGQKTVERACHRHFGFTPKILLRRQRFMRSLSKYMLDPSLTWIGALDPNYHDQAQFVRDFREFMGTTPGEYATQPHPVLEVFMRERIRVAGSPVQTMDRPEGARPAAAAIRV